ncbi:MAG: 50S ribosomal protein L29 [Nitrospirae bacterium]|nr:50S ribosomal protein L29 [Nitrospirota bacterium]MBF0541532.1 50S ribosomal protein L29 [Nitrospirota bacterium]
MKPTEIRALTNDEITSKVSEMRKELFNLRFQAATGEIQNPLRIRALKRDIARAKTIAKEKMSKENKKLVKNNA